MVALLQDECESNPQVISLQEYLGEATIRLADYQREQGRTAAALETYHSSHKIFGDLLAADPRDSLAKTNFGFSNLGSAQCLVKLAKPAAALRTYREANATDHEGQIAKLQRQLAETRKTVKLRKREFPKWVTA